MKKEISKKEEDWLQKKWRPMMAVMYMVVCTFDFVLFPVLFTVVQFWEVEASNDAFRQWQPITLLSGGLFHVAMGAVLGVTAWSRGQEKIAGAATNGGLQLPTSIGSTFTATQTMGQPQPASYNVPASYSSFEQTSPRSMPEYRTAGGGTFMSKTGKAGPMQPEHPEI